MMPLDKQAHALSGAVIALALGFVFTAWVGLAAVIAAGAIKEWYDKLHPATHCSDVFDFLATAAGGLAGCIFVI
ncbi:hypothetical protein [Rhodoferax sp.]|uniref:hypothetical protein n=1 Tax=Rhodoferax sp. TaxID=50421 RepID=UPI00260D2137|nr:hypothetical protein [Rhodoferax sp.]MDD3938097.1 hypothetical protein [Rhodoferax sp.]